MGYHWYNPKGWDLASCINNTNGTFSMRRRRKKNAVCILTADEMEKITDVPTVGFIRQNLNKPNPRVGYSYLYQDEDGRVCSALDKIEDCGTDTYTFRSPGPV